INAQIFAGYGFAHTAMWNQAGPETARNPFFFHDLNRQYAYNYTRGRDMVFSALNASGAVYNGTWTWQGNPIVVNIVQRTEDQRFQVGQYVASQIQSLGLVATETFAYSDRISNVAYDLDGGLWSPFAVRTARFASPGGTLQVGQRLQFLSAWQPWQGFSSIYDLVVGNTFMDSGVAIHPHTGQYIPVRAAFDTMTAGPAGSLSVPTDAILYNPSTGSWESVVPGTTSHSKVTFNYTFGNWHDGPAVNMNDILYDVALI